MQGVARIHVIKVFAVIGRGINAVAGAIRSDERLVNVKDEASRKGEKGRNGGLVSTYKKKRQ